MRNRYSYSASRLEHAPPPFLARVAWQLLLLSLSGSTFAAFGQSFAPVAVYSTGTVYTPYGLAIADMNNDGKVDIVMGNSNNDVVGILFANSTGNGTFQPIATYPTGYNSIPQGLAVADVNNDGKPDIITGHVSGNSVGVMLGNGNGTFQPIVTYNTGSFSRPGSIAVVDVNGDGNRDIITADYRNAAVTVMLGNGDGTFQYYVPYATGYGSSPESVAVADVSGDGQPDIVVGNNSQGTIGVFKGTGTGAFQAMVSYSAGGPNSRPYSVAVADVNGDGIADILSANYLSYAVGVLLGTGAGSFQPVATYSTGVFSLPGSLALADINRDGKLDVIAADYNGSKAVLLLGNGTSTNTFQAPLTYSTGTGVPQTVAAGDLNGDNKPDIVMVNYGSNTAGVLLNTITLLAAQASVGSAQLALWPNPTPVGTGLELTLTSLPAEVSQVEATLCTTLGQVATQALLRPAQGAIRAELPTTNLVTGLYVLRLRAYTAQGVLVGTIPAQRVSVR